MNLLSRYTYGAGYHHWVILKLEPVNTKYYTWSGGTEAVDKFFDLSINFVMLEKGNQNCLSESWGDVQPLGRECIGYIIL